MEKEVQQLKINASYFVFQKNPERSFSEKLIEIFEKSKDFRKSVIKAGQDTDEPDFGRK